MTLGKSRRLSVPQFPRLAFVYLDCKLIGAGTFPYSLFAQHLAQQDSDLGGDLQVLL